LQQKASNIPASFQEALERGLCLFIEGDLKDKTAVFCEHARVPGSSYCEGHKARCYVKSRPFNPGAAL
jgi:hypothetical protein